MGKTGRDVKYLTVEDLVQINLRQIDATHGYICREVFGNLRSFESLSYLVSLVEGRIVNLSENGFFEKAAMYLFRLAGSQLFFDGNKRTGINAAFIFLEKNGFSEKRIVSQDEIIDVALRVARKEMSLGDIAVWLDDIFSV